MKLIKQIFELFKNNKYTEIINIFETSYGLDYNIKDNNDMYMIHYSLISNNEKLINIILNANANIDILDKEGFSILYVPIKYNLLKIINLLVNNNNVGIPITEIKDKNGLIALNYAIEFKNFEIFKLILQYTKNINNIDNYSNNILLNIIFSKQYDILIEYLQRDDLNINLKNKYGMTALHEACKDGSIEPIKLLLNNKHIQVNSLDIYNNTPLMHCLNIDNLNIIHLLINSNSNVNIQNTEGYTCLHRCIYNKNINIANILIHKITEYNLVNIDGETVLHSILLQDIENIYKYDIVHLIKNINLNIQDIKGNTILHYLANLNILMNFKTLLINKKNNIFIKNNENITVNDIMKNKPNYDNFINVIIESYLNILLNNSHKFITNWENNCKKDINKCKKKIIYNIFKKNISIPIKKESHNPIIINDKQDINLFLGTRLITITGLILLHKTSKSVMTTLNNNNIIYNTQLKNNINIGIDFYNIDIIWFYQQIFYPDNFNNIIKNFIKSNKTFLIIPLSIHYDQVDHQNIIIIDKIQKIIERFEPHGSNSYICLNIYNSKLLDSILKLFFFNYFKDYDYYDPTVYIPAVGFQNYEATESIYKYFNDPPGYCTAWCFWYVKHRLINHNIPLKKLIIKLLNTLRYNNVSLKKIIRSFAKTLILNQNITFKSLSNELNKYFVNKTTYIELDKMQSLILKLII